MLAEILQWGGCIFGIIGSSLLAWKSNYSGLGFVSYLVSNIFWILFGFTTGATGLITMQIVFTITSMVGIYKWVLK